VAKNIRTIAGIVTASGILGKDLTGGSGGVTGGVDDGISKWERLIFSLIN